LIWGTTWLVIKFQLGVVSPEVSVAYRFGLASLVLFGWCAVRRTPLRFRARQHLSLLLLGILQFALNYVLRYLAERAITSGLEKPAKQPPLRKPPPADLPRKDNPKIGARSSRVPLAKGNWRARPRATKW
jgi:hypothetical protein